ncbi:hypothetical protein NRK67_17235 (plasmid) [Fusobacteria bacterium ZRK30]|nr:hypothetical protein NRK67_17235 [Fusobacteria bacterium ZRK30]
MTVKQLNDFDGNSRITKSYDNYKKKTKYTTDYQLDFNIDGRITGQDMTITKIVEDDGSKFTFASINFESRDWMRPYEMIFNFDNEMYTVKLEAQQKEVFTEFGHVRVRERCTFDIQDDFFEKWIAAKNISYKVYTTNAGSFEKYLPIDKNGKWSTNYRTFDKILLELLKK